MKQNEARWYFGIHNDDYIFCIMIFSEPFNRIRTFQYDWISLDFQGFGFLDVLISLHCGSFRCGRVMTDISFTSILDNSSH